MRGAGPRERPPLWLRRHTKRQAARQRIVTRTRVGLTPEQRAHDPLAHRRRSATARTGLLIVALIAAAAVHVGVGAVGFVVGGRQASQRRAIEQTVRVEMREPPPSPPPPPPAPIPDERRRDPPRPHPVAERPPAIKPKTPPPPPPTTRQPPPRVVGISLDSTVEGGAGPAFATGETHLGRTAEEADAPRPPGPAALPAPPRPAAPTGRNQVASRIPIAGVEYTPPRRKRPHEPRYPEALKAQEIEADVTVMVAIDARGVVTSVEIIRAAAYPEFNEAAQAAARAEEYDPALRDGLPVPNSLSYTYRFRLETK